MVAEVYGGCARIAKEEEVIHLGEEPDATPAGVTQKAPGGFCR
jgi:hypothetical protein